MTRELHNRLIRYIEFQWLEEKRKVEEGVKRTAELIAGDMANVPEYETVVLATANAIRRREELEFLLTELKKLEKEVH